VILVEKGKQIFRPSTPLLYFFIYKLLMMLLWSCRL